MSVVKGKFRTTIYRNEVNGYLVALFRVKECSEDLSEYVNKTITITGLFASTDDTNMYSLTGDYTKNDKYGSQFVVTSYEKMEPTTASNLIDYLSSKLIKGCSVKTATNIVNILGDDTLKLIKEDYRYLLKVPGITENKAKKIADEIAKINNQDGLIIKLKEMGFSLNDAVKILNKYKNETEKIVNNNLYLLTDMIEFPKLDTIYINYNDKESIIRIKACVIEGMKRLTNRNGDTYSYYDEISSVVNNEFEIYVDSEKLNEIIENLIKDGIIIVRSDRYYLKENYDYEMSIVHSLYEISKQKSKRIDNFEELIKDLQNENNIFYNEDQKNALKTALEQNVTIISGGPGTGKTTIINALVKLYIKINNLSPFVAFSHIALLAPTGRASKKMSLSTGFGASTIHRFLKWNKETNDFGINKDNKLHYKFIIVDESSMIDTHLMASLLEGLDSDIKIVFVGDIYQLPSVGPGLILNDLITSDCFNFCMLNEIYRQSSASYIPYLAKDIKNKNISEELFFRRNDYNFINVTSDQIKNSLRQICEYGLSKGLNEEQMQILVPMYKGENGIDNLNLMLQDIYNPANTAKKEVRIGETDYRVNDKVLQLVNNPDLNVFNGDIGYIRNMAMQKVNGKFKEIITIDFDGNIVEYTKKNMFDLKHAYAISIHKSQGSEFNNVVMPLCRGYYRMLYNKLIYTGVSRAKDSLTIIGDPNCLNLAINNDYSNNRKTSLKVYLTELFFKNSE